MFVKNAWYIAALASEAGDKPLARTILGKPLVLFRSQEGTIAVLDDRCCHRGLPLSLGEVVNDGLQCGYHGLVFDTGGKCVRIPGQDRIPAAACVRHYPCIERHEFIWVWMGDAGLAATTPLVTDPAWEAGWAGGRHEATMCAIRCNYQMVVDNLMDVTHVGYVHRNTIGGNAEVHSKAPTTVSRTPSGVKFVRWMRGSVPPKTYVNAAGFTGLVDRWQVFEYVAPSVIFQHSGSVDHGKAEGVSLPADLPADVGGVSFRILHGMTPETQESCFYFWSLANPSDLRTGANEAPSQLFIEVREAFDEDKMILEAQEARLAQTPGLPLVDIASDAARIAARRAVDMRLAEEAKAAA